MHSELSRVRGEELEERERERLQLRAQQEAQEQQWLRERLKVEEAERQVAEMQKQAEEVNEKLAELSANSQQLFEGEQEAIETGEGPLRRLRFKRSDCFQGQTAAEFHFPLTESQFLRMMGGGAAYHVTEVEYLINPPLLKRYHDFMNDLREQGQPVQERLTFHGTTGHAIDAIVKEGFKIGGQGVPIRNGSANGKGIYSSELPSVAMGYVRSSSRGDNRLLFSRLCPSVTPIETLGPMVNYTWRCVDMSSKSFQHISFISGQCRS